MEKRLFSRSEVVPLGRTCWKPLMGESIRWRSTQRLSWCGGRGNLVKASYSAARTPSRDIDPVSHKMLLSSNSYRGFGINGEPSKIPARIGCVLDAYEDEYGGVIVNSERLPWNASDFGSILHASLSHWKAEGKKGVWLKLPLDLSELVPIAVKEGFKYHHAEQEYVMLTYWIPEGRNMLPANASHQVGVGGFVINDQNEVLVVQEKYCSSSSSAIWKLPTGFINESEEIFDGVVREVKEETGVETEFLEVVAFRHAHCVSFKKSDLFFICMLRPFSTQIEIDDMEIQAAKWMPLVEFIEQPFIQADDMFRKIAQICIARLRKRYCGLLAHHVISKFDGKYSSLYYNVSEAPDFHCQGD